MWLCTYWHRKRLRPIDKQKGIFKSRVVTDWMFTSPRIHALRPNPQSVGIWLGGPLGGHRVTRVEPSWVGLVPLLQGPQRAPSPFCPVKSQQGAETSLNQKPALTRPGICLHLDLGLPASGAARNTFLLLISYPFSGILLHQREQTKTQIHSMAPFKLSCIYSYMVMVMHTGTERAGWIISNRWRGFLSEWWHFRGFFFPLSSLDFQMTSFLKLWTDIIYIFREKKQNWGCSRFPHQSFSTLMF